MNAAELRLEIGKASHDGWTRLQRRCGWRQRRIWAVRLFMLVHRSRGQGAETLRRTIAITRRGQSSCACRHSVPTRCGDASPVPIWR